MVFNKVLIFFLGISFFLNQAQAHIFNRFHNENPDSVQFDVFEISDTLRPEIRVTFSEVKISDFKPDRSYENLPYSSQTLNTKTLQKNPAANIMQSIDQMPGIHSMNIGSGAAKPVIRGMGFNRLTVIHDGVKQEGQQWGADHGLEIDGFAMEQVELIRGPASLMYGGEAMTGVLSLNSFSVPELNTVSTIFVSQAQSNTQLFGGSVQVQANMNGFFVKAQVSEKHFGDIRVPASDFRYGNYVYPIANQKLQNTAGNEKAMGFNAGFDSKKFTTILSYNQVNQQFGFFPGAHGRPNNAALIDDGDSRNIDMPHQNIQHQKLAATFNAKSQNNPFSLVFSYQENNRDEFEKPHRDSDDFLALSLRLQTFASTLNAKHVISKNTEIVYGGNAEFKQNTASGRSFLLPDFNSFQSGIYAIVNQKIGAYTFSSGIRGDLGSISANVPLVSDANFPILNQFEPLDRNFQNVSGSAGFSKTKSRSILKVNVGSAFRMPNAPELLSNGVHHGAFRYERGNSDLEIERSFQVDVSEKIYFQEGQATLEWAVYATFYDNFIYLSPSGRFAPNAYGGGQVHQYVQANAIHSGGELSFTKSLGNKWQIQAAADVVIAHNLESNRPLPFMPPATLFSELNYDIFESAKIQKFYVYGQIRAALAQHRVERNEFSTPAFAIGNIGFGSEVKLGDHVFFINLIAQNVFNTTYYSHLSRMRMLNLPEQGRNFVLQVRVPLQKKLQ